VSSRTTINRIDSPSQRELDNFGGAASGEHGSKNEANRYPASTPDPA